MNRKMSKPKGHRQGFILLATLAILAVVISILLPLVPASLHKRRQIRNDQLRLQRTYILSAMLQRSLAKFANDNNYAGEEVEIEMKHDNAPYKAVATANIADHQLAIRIEIQPAELNTDPPKPPFQATIDRHWNLP